MLPALGTDSISIETGECPSAYTGQTVRDDPLGGLGRYFMKINASTLTILAAAVLLLQGCGSTTGDDTELESLLDSAADQAGVPPGTCREECVARALAVFDDCLTQSDDREMCFGRAIQGFFECATECRPPTCEERCEAQARQHFMSCVDEIGDEDACAAEAREGLRVCVHETCMDSEPPTC